jgi:DNA-binding NarL/FixJ family response regulator
MAINSGTGTPAGINAEQPVSFDVLWGADMFAESFVKRLEAEGLTFDKGSTIKLIIDIPNGYTLHTLQALERRTGDLRTIAVTFSSCVEYWEDLSDLHPDVLIVDPSHEYDLAGAIRRASKGEGYRTVPLGTSPLNRTERQILARVARGLSAKQIGDALNMREKTVSNSLRRIYDKIGCANRIEAILHYWGVWH